MRTFKVVQRVLQNAKYCEMKLNCALHFNAMLYHCTGDSNEEVLPYEWYEKAFPKLTRLAHLLKDVDLVDGRLVNVNDDSIISDDCIDRRMNTFKSVMRVFIGSPSVQLMLKKQISAFDCFGKPSEREPMIVNSLTTVSNVLNVTAQQRKLVRLTICPQVTQHKIWTGALEKILNELKTEIGLLNCQFPSKGTKMGQQIVCSCLKFLDESAGSYDPDSASWIRLSPAKVVDSPRKWEDVFEMFNDLINCLKSEKDRLYHLKKIEVMKEGVSQIRDVLADNSIGYKDAGHQESLVQKKLSKTLGHSSQCLFTLLLYYLYGQVRDLEVDLCGAVYGNGSDNKLTLCMGRILTSNEEKMVWSGVKQLERALGLFKFVWETSGMKGILELQGHLWCVGSEERSITYRGNAFFLHGISFGPKSTSSKPL
ncbi:EG45-like domain containing protein-like [Hibiscus syriacus]|uniref:EG45-like domain containing protein-like n=1 Tax=Hibiscus syriacus TaxID=106335 RepID=A0A6A3D128_HIBSY|nr:uncharacterized protein LOC120202292 [Hibiscus syriacus]KAE8735443.1 EG45-like domain containing protein-like [Hibiscus syriacus]